jgi:hypothetical protein
MANLDNVYIWFYHDPCAVIIARGATLKEALQNFKKEQHSDYYNIESCDGYYRSPDVTLYGNLRAEFGEFTDRVKEYREIVEDQKSVILRVHTRIEER